MVNNWRHIDTFERDKDGNPLFTGAVLVNASDGTVGEAEFRGGDWWWANSYGEYWASEIRVIHGDVAFWQPMIRPHPETVSETG
jgi:hypothetical protein